MRSRGTFNEFENVVQEYFQLNHAELVPKDELEKTCTDVYYFPMQVVRKEDSSTSKVCVVFDTSAHSTSGMSLNDHFMIGPTVHSSLSDVLLHFRRYKVALTTYVSGMY